MTLLHLYKYISEINENDSSPKSYSIRALRGGGRLLAADGGSIQARGSFSPGWLQRLAAPLAAAAAPKGSTPCESATVAAQRRNRKRRRWLTSAATLEIRNSNCQPTDWMHVQANMGQQPISTPCTSYFPIVPVHMMGHAEYGKNFCFHLTRLACYHLIFSMNSHMTI